MDNVQDKKVTVKKTAAEKVAVVLFVLFRFPVKVIFHLTKFAVMEGVKILPTEQVRDAWEDITT